MAGRPRKALDTNKKHFTRLEKEERRRSESTHKVGRSDLLDFEHGLEGLSEIGREEYRRIVSLARWLDDLDRADVVAYCSNYERVQRLLKNADFGKDVLGVTRADGSRRFVVNPLLKIYRDCCAEMRAISLKLGISTLDRLKLAAPPVEEKTNKFVELLLKGGKK